MSTAQQQQHGYMPAAATTAANTNKPRLSRKITSVTDAPASFMPEAVAADKHKIDQNKNLPPDIATKMAELEAKTGKTYKYRPNIPSIQHMLVHGAPEEDGRPSSLWDKIKYPLVLALLFGLTLVVFHHVIDPAKKKRNYSIPKGSMLDKFATKKMLPIKKSIIPDDKPRDFKPTEDDPDEF